MSEELEYIQDLEEQNGALLKTDALLRQQLAAAQQKLRGFCEVHDADSDGCPCCEAVHQADLLAAAQRERDEARARLRESTVQLKVVYAFGVHTKKLESIGEQIDANNAVLDDVEKASSQEERGTPRQLQLEAQVEGLRKALETIETKAMERNIDSPTLREILDIARTALNDVERASQQEGI